MADPETLALLEQVDEGSAAALDALFQRELPRLRRLLSMRTPPDTLQQVGLADLVQEAYVEALRQLPAYSYQGKDSFFRWLATVAVHRAQNLGRAARADRRDRRREVRFVGAESAGGIHDVEAAAPGPRTLALGRDEAAVLESAMRRLRDVDREVIVLARIEGRSIQEIATRLDRTANATALLLTRALRKLRDHLREGSA